MGADDPIVLKSLKPLLRNGILVERFDDYSAAMAPASDQAMGWKSNSMGKLGLQELSRMFQRLEYLSDSDASCFAVGLELV